MSQDVERLCASFTEFFANVTKPILDIMIYSKKLHSTVGALTPVAMTTYLWCSGMFLTWLRRPMAAYTSLIQAREGEYRYMCSRLITNAEEVAFYRGVAREKTMIQRGFGRLVAAIRRSQQFRFSMDMVDSVVAKYLATVVGWLAISRTLYLEKYDGSTEEVCMLEACSSFPFSTVIFKNLSEAYYVHPWNWLNRRCTSCFISQEKWP